MGRFSSDSTDALNICKPSVGFSPFLFIEVHSFSYKSKHFLPEEKRDIISLDINKSGQNVITTFRKILHIFLYLCKSNYLCYFNENVPL